MHISSMHEPPIPMFGFGSAWSKSMDISEVLRQVREGHGSCDVTRSKVHALMPISKDWEEVCVGQSSVEAQFAMNPTNTATLNFGVDSSTLKRPRNDGYSQPQENGALHTVPALDHTSTAGPIPLSLQNLNTILTCFNPRKTCLFQGSQADASAQTLYHCSTHDETVLHALQWRCMAFSKLVLDQQLAVSHQIHSGRCIRWITLQLFTFTSMRT